MTSKEPKTYRDLVVERAIKEVIKDGRKNVYKRLDQEAREKRGDDFVNALRRMK